MEDEITKFDRMSLDISSFELAYLLHRINLNLSLS